MNTRFMNYPKIMTKHSIKMTEVRLINWRETLQTIIDIKNGNPPDDINEYRGPPYLCQEQVEEKV